MLTPYVVDYLARTSAILMPWAGLGWLVGFLVVAVRRGGWRYPALFALVVALIGGVNATSVLLVGLAPLLWVLLAGITREASWRDVTSATLRAAVLSVLVSVWWIAGLWAEGSSGINVLRYTETFPTVTMTSQSSEVLRGLGYWYFYGNDAIQPWTQPSSGYMQHVPWILISFLVPGLALLGAAFVRWRYRAFAVLVAVLGVVLAVGAYPLNSPTPVGHVLRSIGENSTIGLAMRSSNRVVPIVVLGLALLAGSAVSALARWRPTVGMASSLVVGALACANLAPLFEGNLVASNLMFPEHLPTYVTSAARYLNRTGTTPVLALPGEDFGYYRWGVTMDSVWPGLLRRPYIQRQAVLQGEPASANLLRALDESIQDGVMVPASIGPMAQLLGAGDVLLQSNLQYERFDLPRPQALWLALHPTPAGLEFLRGFGPAKLVPTDVGTILDETQLMIPPGASYPPALAVYKVRDPRALLRTESMQDPIVLDGDGEGILLAAAAGLLGSPPRAIVYAAAASAAELRRLGLSQGTELVVTDTNAKELDTWGTLHTTFGYVEQPNEVPLSYEPSEQALPIFVNQSPSTQTVLLLHGIRAVGASSYGNPVANAPEDQPFAAVDGNRFTAWETGAFSDPRGQFLRITFAHPITLRHLELLQPQIGIRTRWVTKVRLNFSSGPPVRLRLGLSSRSSGQSFDFAAHRTSSLTITISGMSGSQTNFSGQNGVGFAEVTIPGVTNVTASLRTPTDLLGRLGIESAGDPLIILLHRLRAATVPPRTDPELWMSRTIWLPTARRFTITGTASLSALVDDARIEGLVGQGGGTGLHVVSTVASTRLVGSLTNSSWAVFDDNPSTSWMPAFAAGPPQWVSAKLSGPLTVSHLTLRVLDDHRHSLPTSLEVSNGSDHETVALTYPSRRGRVAQGATVTMDLTLPHPLTGHAFVFSFPTQKTSITIDHISGNRIALPIGVADIVLPGLATATMPTQIPTTCRSGLLSVDGKDVPIRVSGSTAAALAQAELPFSACGGPISVPADTAVVMTTPGYRSGLNVDALALSSPAGGLAATAATRNATARVRHVHWSNPVTLHARLGPQSAASWLVLNQSFSSGWKASVNGRDLGAPQLLDGAFTAWSLPALRQGGALTITWTPQGTVDDALVLSLVGLVVVVACIALRPRRRRAAYAAELDEDHAPVLALPWRQLEGPSLVLAGVATVVAIVIAGPAIALLAIPLVALAWRWPRLRAVLALAPAAAIGLCGLYVAYLEYRHFAAYPHNIQWTSHFPDANTLGWIAVALLMVDVAAFGRILGMRPSHAVEVARAASTRPTLVGIVRARLEERRAQRPPRPPRERPSVPQRVARALPARLHGPLAVLLPKYFGAEEPPDVAGTIISLPGSGISRSVALLRAFRKEQTDPDLFYRTLALDTLHRLTGATPLYNRTVLDVGGGPGYFGEAFRSAGARVVLVEPEAAAPLPESLDVPDELLELRERHEKTVWPGRLLPGDTIAGDGMALPLPDDSVDVAFSSNVLEHVVDPRRFLDESIRVTRPGGLLYLSFTVWHGPWGGHETSPWHLVSGEYARRRYERRHGRPPKNVFGESLFKVHVGTVLKELRERGDVEVVAVEPRYYPSWARFIVKVPVLRELLTWNLVVLLEKL